MKPFSRMCITISVLSSNTQNLASIPSMSTLCTNQFSNYSAIQYCNIFSYCCQACSSLYANKCEYFLIDLLSFSFTVNFYLPPSSDLLFGLVCGFLRILPWISLKLMLFCCLFLVYYICVNFIQSLLWKHHLDFE